MSRQRLDSPRPTASSAGLQPELSSRSSTEERGLGRYRPLRDRRHAAEGDARLDDTPVDDVELEGAHHGRDVLVEALRHLVAAEMLVRPRASRHGDADDELAGPAVLPAIVEEEVLERQGSPVPAMPQIELGPERDQRRRQVADRRAVGDVAARRCRMRAPARSRTAASSSPRSGSMAASAAAARLWLTVAPIDSALPPSRRTGRAGRRGRAR